MTVVNFSAGPATLPNTVLDQAQKELLNWNGTGMSVLEMSHRSSHFESIIQKAQQTLRSLLQVPENYSILFMQGGGTLQFASVFLNFANKGDKVDYMVSGQWSKKAAQEASKLGGQVNYVFNTSSSGYVNIPSKDQWKLSGKESKYVYYCENETVNGVQFDIIPEIDDSVPLICDASSSFLSKPFPVSKFGLIFAGAQKNIGPAGVTVVLIRNDLLKEREIPSVMDYSIMAKNGSMYNTPPTYSIYVTGLVLEYFNSIGLSKLSECNQRKAKLLYQVIDSFPRTYSCPVAVANRSIMNVVFRVLGKNGKADEEREKDFLSKATQRGMIELKGHRSVGGLRASIYNSMTEESVKVLADFMNSFADNKL